jgi:tRNA(Arg) A34 adenosine deaminase TadA
MAIAFAQKKLQTWDLGRDAAMPTTLVTSSQPCLMCLGAVLWSGVTSLSFGALAVDVSGLLGFDEGPLPDAWEQKLWKRRIKVESGILRAEAMAVLELYKRKQGTVYNSRKGF